MQTTKEKVDTSKAMDASSVDTESRQQHTEQPELNNEGEFVQNAKECYDTCPLPAIFTDNQIPEHSYQSLEYENICLKKTVAQFKKNSRLEAHFVNPELKYQNQVLNEGQHSQFLKEKSNEAKVKHDIDVIETINIELEHKVSKLLKEMKTLGIAKVEKVGEGWKRLNGCGFVVFGSGRGGDVVVGVLAGNMLGRKEGCVTWDGGNSTWGGRAKVFGTVPVCLGVQERAGDNAPNMFLIRMHHGGKFQRPLTSLDEGLYDLACEEDVCCLATFVRSFKLIETGHESSETTKEPVCDSVTPSSLPQHDLSTPRIMFGVDTQSHVFPIIQAQFSDINLSFVSQQATASQVIDDVMRRLSFTKIELDGEAGFVDVAGSGLDSSGLSHDESFRVDNLDLNLNEHVNLNVSQVETQFELLVFEEPDVEVSTHVPIVEEVGTQEFSVEDVVLEDYFFYDDEGIDTTYETKYDVQSSEDAGTDDDDKDEDFLVDEENKIVDSDVDVYLFGISMDIPFDDIGVTNLVPDDEEKVSRVEQRNERRNLKLYKNDSVRIRTKCDKKSAYFYNVTRVNSYIPIKAVQDQLQRDLKVQISMSKACKSKAKAKREIRGDHVLQYSMLRDYVVKLQSTNPNTTVKITVERNTDSSLPTRVFQRIYVCFEALKLGFRACRRDLLGLDGAFMKGPFLGQVLAAVGLDSNNGIHPLAYALVKAKTPPSEEWVNHCYWLTTYRETYSHKVQLICRNKYWEKSTCPTTLLPPKGRPRKKRKRSKHEDEPFVKDGKLSRKGRTLTCQSCRNTGYNKATCKGQDRKATTSGNNVEAIGSASRQEQQTEHAASKDGFAKSGGVVVIGLSTGQGGPDGVSQVIDNRKFMMVDKEDLIFKKISPMAEEILEMLCVFVAKKKVTDIIWYTDEIREQVEKLADCWRIVSYFVEKAIKNMQMMNDVGVCFTLRVPPHLPEYHLIYGAWLFEQYQDYVRVVVRKDARGKSKIEIVYIKGLFTFIISINLMVLDEIGVLVVVVILGTMWGLLLGKTTGDSQRSESSISSPSSHPLFGGEFMF
nr:hypothetical protein [Tanacetum cinerariifolium]